MRIIMEQPQPDEEDQIIVRCRNLSSEIISLLGQIQTQGEFLIGYTGDEIHRVPSRDIYYVEAIDRKTFLYCESKVYESKQKLYELEEDFGSGDFIRVSKSVILNMSKIKSLLPSLSGRIEVVLKNDERVIISRQYVQELKKLLGV
ncbi:MAG: LytTR family transcriptional regulator [Oscillospiraceae bacterium]|nr:LytTR family transcriptional regulator [Oscillospiraceae bacterium]